MLFYIVLVLGSALALPEKIRIYDVEVAEVYFKEFIFEYNKHYSSDEEYQMRFQIFKQNLKDINDKNFKYGPRTVFGITKFSDMTKEEFSLKMLGLKLSDSPPTVDLCKMAPVPDQEPPAKLDYREKGVITPVKDQGGCGSCWAFSTIGLIESNVAMQKKEMVSLSEQQLVDCDKSNRGCSGGIMDKALSFLIKNGGEESDADYPYNENENDCQFDSSKVKVKLADCHHIDVDSSSESWKKALFKYGPLAIGLLGTGLDNYHGGIVNCEINSKPDHAVLLVGYGEENGEKYWIIKNSWGATWGEKGYFRLNMTEDNPCNMFDIKPVTVTIE